MNTIHLTDHQLKVLAELGLADPGKESRPFIHCTVQDDRGDPTHPRVRFVYLFPNFEQMEYRSEMLSRLAELMKTNHLPFVCRPLELAHTSEGALCVLTPKYDHCLSDLMTASVLAGGADRAWKIFGKLLEGVVGLHEHNICHGDLRLDTIFLDAKDDTPWITATAWGPLANWTHGTFLTNETTANYPPEFEGKTQAPTPAADVYALGRIGLQMLTGFVGTKPKDIPQALSTLPYSQARLLARMLADDKNKRVTANQALTSYRNPGSFAARFTRPVAAKLSEWNPSRFVTLRNGLLGGCLAIAVILLFALLRNLDNNTRVEAMKKDVANCLDLVAKKEGEVRQQKETFDQDLLVQLKLSQLKDDEIRNLKDKLKGTADDKYKTLSESYDSLSAKYGSLKRDSKAKDARCEEEEARRIWMGKAYDPYLAYSKFTNLTSKEAQDQIKTWLDQFEEAPEYNHQKDKWYIILEKGEANTETWGNNWKVEVKVDSGDWQTLRENHPWDEPQSHTYKDTWVSVKWMPDQPITVRLIRVKNPKNDYTFIHRVFDGPLAMWQLHNNGWLYHLENREYVGIKLSVWNCPGPDRWKEKETR